MADRLKPRNLIIGALVLSAVILSMSEYTTSLFNQNNLVGNYSFSSLNVTEDVNTFSGNLQTQMQTKPAQNVATPFDSFIINVIASTQTIFNLPNTLGTTISIISQTLRIGDSPIIGTVMTIVGLILVFAIIEIVTRVEV